MQITEATKPNTLRNFQMQATGAEMLRVACCLITEAGIDLCAPVHDAVLVEGDAETIDETIAAVRRLMGQASTIVLDGHEVPTEVEVVMPGSRYSDERGAVMWERVTELLAVRNAVRGSSGQDQHVL